ncbi:MAG: hypothetical protein OXC62_03810 [Aestuariivita sp.]|nr:hypothetical protein [Aestuariivita sp.]
MRVRFDARKNRTSDAAFASCNAAVGQVHANGVGFIADTARAYASVYIGRRAAICGNARTQDHARIEDNAVVIGNAVVYMSAVISGNGVVSEDAAFIGSATVTERAVVTGKEVSGNTIHLRLCPSDQVRPGICP